MFVCPARGRQEFKCRVCITCDIEESPFVAQQAWDEIAKESADPLSPLHVEKVRHRIAAVGARSISSSSSDEAEYTEPEQPEIPGHYRFKHYNI